MRNHKINNQAPTNEMRCKLDVKKDTNTALNNSSSSWKVCSS